ncbi:unnamed protein product [Oppiella nova]|uniref:Ig-like domain-containing protein n=1 Tax=Oppiella nova TaxID=334625 RepID=A0A7R9MAW0_9ACAR|nr:unnamed protein product [Oppiella nova]CAG2172722.1 unnamed protein product [Oppiella nova]
MCLVNIEGNSLIDISWDYDSYDFSRKTESFLESITKQTSGGVFETVSRSLTIVNASHIDSGVYTCNVTDFSETTYSVSKHLFIRSHTYSSNPFINSASLSPPYYIPLIIMITVLCV